MERRKMGNVLDSGKIEDLKGLGEYLRDRREKMNVSLKEAENTTSIRIPYLQALENGEMAKLISPVYAQGFFKNYASFLGIDGEQVVRDNPHIFAKGETQEFVYGIGTLEGRGSPGSHVKWFPNALWIISFIMVFIAAWYTAHLLGLIG